MLEKAECRTCHNDNGVSSATRLQFPAPEASTDAVQLFGLKLSTLIDREDMARSPLLNKPTLRVPHTGGERIRKGSPQEELLKTWAAYLASQPYARLQASIDRQTATLKGPAPAH